MKLKGGSFVQSPLTACPSQKKHLSTEVCGLPTLWRVYFLGTSAVWSQEVFLFSARNSFALLYSSLHESCHLDLWCSNVVWMPSPSSSLERSIVLGRHPMLLKARRLSARVWHPEPTLLRCDSAGQHSFSEVSFWHSTHWFQSVRHGRCVPDVLGCWGSITLKRLAIVSQSYATTTVTWKQT